MSCTHDYRQGRDCRCSKTQSERGEGSDDDFIYRAMSKIVTACICIPTLTGLAILFHRFGPGIVATLGRLF